MEPCTEREHIQETRRDIAVIKEILHAQSDANREIADRQRKVLKTLFGDDHKGGLISVVNNNSKSLSRNWGFTLFLVFAIMGIAFFIIRGTIAQ